MPVSASIAKKCTTRSNAPHARRRCTRRSRAGSLRPNVEHTRAPNRHRHHRNAQKSIASFSMRRIVHPALVVCSKEERSASPRSDCWAGSCARLRLANPNEDSRDLFAATCESTSAVFIFNAGCRIYTLSRHASINSGKRPRSCALFDRRLSPDEQETSGRAGNFANCPTNKYCLVASALAVCCQPECRHPSDIRAHESQRESGEHPLRSSIRVRS